MRPIHWALTVALALGVCPPLHAADDAPATRATRPARAPAPDADERAVAALVRKMGSAEFATRDAAARELEHLGPELIPALQKYRNDPDPEIASRVNAVIRSFVWMNNGAIITHVTSGSAADRAGVRRGDVIVKIDDIDITGHLDLAKADRAAGRTYQIWRGGHVRTVKGPAGTFGIRASNWDVAKGGSDHSRGLALLDGPTPDYPAAYRRLRRARDEGMDDPHTLQLLSALAARELDQDYSTEVYRAYRAASRLNCNTTHKFNLEDVMGLPFFAPHGAYLLERYRNDPFSPNLYHELEDWAARYGCNYPWARELVAAPWPAAAGATPQMQTFDEFVRIRVHTYQRRWDDALADFANRTPTSDAFFEHRADFAFRAALKGERPTAAVDIALDFLSKAHANPDRAAPYGPALWAPALAAATNSGRDIDRFMTAFAALDRTTINALTRSPSGSALYHPSLGRYLIPFLEKDDALRAVGNLEQVYLAQLTTDPATTADQFVAATGRMDAQRAAERMAAAAARTADPTVRDAQVIWAIVTGLMRFDEYDRALDILTAAARGRDSLMGASLKRATAAAAFAKAHAGDKALHGIVQVIPGREPGLIWALRWDGHVLRVTADGTAHDDPGLPTPPAAVSIAYEHLRVTDACVACRLPYGRTRVDQDAEPACDVPYVYDRRAGRWASVETFDGPIDIGGREDNTGDAIAMRELVRHHKLEAGRPPRRIMGHGADGRWCEDNIYIHVDRATGRALDCSAEIARQAGLARDVQVYLPEEPATGKDNAPDPDAGKIVLATDAGVWVLDTKAMTVTRVKLGLKDEDVITTILPTAAYGRQRGSVLVGVAPQCGGQVFRVDLQTLQAAPTNGFCGLGPRDWFSPDSTAPFGDEYADVVQQAYLTRLANAAR